MPVKSAHTHICLAVSTDLEEAATTRRLEIWREGERLEAEAGAEDNRLSSGSAGAAAQVCS